MNCPICHKRKAKRFCPAKGENICSVCCGTEREVTIDCPSDCPHLIASREYDRERKQQVDWSKSPFPEAKLNRDFVSSHAELVERLAFAICIFAQENRALVDSDVIATLKALADTYRTLSSGIYYERLPDYRLQYELYKTLQAAVEDFKKKQAQTEVTSVRDSEIRDTLVFLAQLGYAHQNGRPKGRAFLDTLRRGFGSPEFEKAASPSIVLLP